ncbi:MAG: Na+/H+ antiporter subunit B [Alphaproteobacteria bacterium]|nr:Na+/H+ antiporter subunit B [Alphaproteobacteria bacterium]
MNSTILKAATRILMALILIFAIYMLLRGHDDPGGGFIGALITSAAFVLYKFAYGSEETRKIMVLDSRGISMLGIGCAIAAGLMSLFTGKTFLTGLWLPAYVEGRIPLPVSTVLLFDIGVYLAVTGAVLTIVLALEEDR